MNFKIGRYIQHLVLVTLNKFVVNRSKVKFTGLCNMYS